MSLSLPMPADRLLLHRPPMLCIDALLSCGEESALVAACLKPGHIFLDADGNFDPAGFIELAAQSAGAMQGWLALRAGKAPAPGLLVGAQDFVFRAPAGVGDELRIFIRLLTAFQGVNVLEARVERNEEIPAEGRIKVFVDNAVRDA